jgi:hypothetical protein
MKMTYDMFERYLYILAGHSYRFEIIGEFNSLMIEEPNPERSVATMPNSSNEADNQIKQNPFGG